MSIYIPYRTVCLRLALVAAFCVAAFYAPGLSLAQDLAPQSVTYYVSYENGDDTNSGLSPSAPIRSISIVNNLPLGPGDRVLFHCGEVWRAEMLRVERSGEAGSPIRYSSYPTSDCADRPVITGAQPITGWKLLSGSIYYAELGEGDNAALFPTDTTDGINALFRDGERLGIGRWPNLNASNGGYATIDSQPANNQFSDAALPDENWTGATAHIKGMRWYILNRNITADVGNSLYVNSELDCWETNCSGWGYWIDSHLATLDQEGEWYYDPATRRVYLYTADSPNDSTIEGAVVLIGESENLGGVILGRHLKADVAHIVIENLEISRWFDNGITTPVNLEKNEHVDIVIQNNYIHEVESAGINLATWVWNAEAYGNGYNGWRGGKEIQIINNTIEVANGFGINSYARDSLIQGNTIREVGLVKNLGKAGMGCSITSGGGSCTEDGDGIRIKVDQDGTYSGNNNTVSQNVLEEIGYNGIDVFGANNTFEQNLISLACDTKGDCGGLRSFGGDSLEETTAHDLVIRDNIILNITGNTDGARTDFAPEFGMGLYIDHHSRDVTVTGNTISNTTFTGLLYQDSTGSITDNTLFNPSTGSMYAYGITLTGNPTLVSTLTGNRMLAKKANAGTLQVVNLSMLTTSDNNGFYHTSRAAHINSSGDKTLAGWRDFSRKDANSTESIAAELAEAELFYNATSETKALVLPGPYKTLAGQATGRTITLEAYGSEILIPTGPAYPLLSIEKQAPFIAEPGVVFTYTLTVGNPGRITVANVTVSDELPDGVEYAGGGDLQSDIVYWTAGDIQPGESLEFTLAVTPTLKNGSIVNSNYMANGDDDATSTGSPVTTLVDPSLIFLPMIAGWR